VKRPLSPSMSAKVHACCVPSVGWLRCLRGIWRFSIVPKATESETDRRFLTHGVHPRMSTESMVEVFGLRPRAGGEVRGLCSVSHTRACLLRPIERLLASLMARTVRAPPTDRLPHLRARASAVTGRRGDAAIGRCSILHRWSGILLAGRRLTASCDDHRVLGLKGGSDRGCPRHYDDEVRLCGYIKRE
jgi:hypothetical protein